MSHGTVRTGLRNLINVVTLPGALEAHAARVDGLLGINPSK